MREGKKKWKSTKLRNSNKWVNWIVKQELIINIDEKKNYVVNYFAKIDTTIKMKKKKRKEMLGEKKKLK